ncbi:hypothetical protein M378DRAFT_156703 [Amanita muscaria Koide BX008]|uniref:Uncharacterized protein n=1 Tax=Amanita muscaria (strain Koide BX008) TaxID=946122 RepID=A0A0C2XN41_AMAMK|nr:hypothetical protein M378DRAFT_156703 [Amanita muscaria Koide BX008]
MKWMPCFINSAQSRGKEWVGMRETIRNSHEYKVLDMGEVTKGGEGDSAVEKIEEVYEIVSPWSHV